MHTGQKKKGVRAAPAKEAENNCLTFLLVIKQNTNPFLTILGDCVEALLVHCTFHPTVHLLSPEAAALVFLLHVTRSRMSVVWSLNFTVLNLSGTQRYTCLVFFFLTGAECFLSGVAIDHTVYILLY